MLVSEFLSSFNKKLYEVAPKEIHRDLERQERTVKHSLFSVVGVVRELAKNEAIKYQEDFHTKIDRMAMDYKTWERGGFKRYAKPKQFVTGRVAAASKKAFDWVLSDFLVSFQKKEEVGDTLERDPLDFARQNGEYFVGSGDELV
jgi:hypothetical protein